VLPYVLWWSNRAVIHLENDDSWTNPPSSERLGRTRPEDRRGRLCVNEGHAACWRWENPLLYCRKYLQDRFLNTTYVSPDIWK
jgi:hypothetical protein